MTPTNTEALAALSYAEAAKLLADELEYKYQRGIDPHDGEWREAVTLLHRLSAVEVERDALMAVLRGLVDAWDGGELSWFKRAYEAMDAARAAMKGTQ